MISAKELAYHILSVYTGFVATVILSGIPPDQALQSGWRFILEGARGSSAEEQGNSTGGDVR